MLHETSLITTLVVSLSLALFFGLIAQKLRVSPIVGYLLAGIIAGPQTPGFVADQNLTQQLSEIGIILLMFGVGLHFSFKDLLSVKKIAISGAISQMCVATMLGFSLTYYLGWPAGGAFIFGLSLSVASTVVLLRTLEERHLLETKPAKIVVGWLVVEDLMTVLALILIPTLAHANISSGDIPIASANFWLTIVITLTKLLAFFIVMVVVGRRLIPWVLKMTAQMGSRELFRLCVLTIALGVAFGSAYLFGVSLPLGAFFAGVIMSETELSHRAAEDSMPLRDAFAVLFFVSVGMLFDIYTIISHYYLLLLTLSIILFGKSLVAFIIMRLFSYPVKTSLIIAASLAQIGEFSFILASLGGSLGLLPLLGNQLILAAAILSILLNPMIFCLCDLLTKRADNNSMVDNIDIEENEIITNYNEENHIVIIGYGRIGQLIVENLQARDSKFVIIETKARAIELSVDINRPVIFGNAANLDVLKMAGVEKAKQIILTSANILESEKIVSLSRELNPNAFIIAYSESSQSTENFQTSGADIVVAGDKQISQILLDKLLPEELLENKAILS